MKLSISNIGWSLEQDTEIYGLMIKNGYSGLEIAPTRVFPENPYDNIKEAGSWSKRIKNTYGFSIPSMQSIWYGRQEKIFGTIEERKRLIEYTKKAIDFATEINCKNLVFGCPKNRNMPEEADVNIVIDFFRELGEYAKEKGTVIGMEANPTIYNTNFINDTKTALEFVKEIKSDGFLLNLDVGTMIQNEENVSELIGNVKLINHVHISEPGLKQIEKRNIHKEINDILVDEEYKGFVSVEMAKVDDVYSIDESLRYVRSVFY